MPLQAEMSPLGLGIRRTLRKIGRPRLVQPVVILGLEWGVGFRHTCNHHSSSNFG
jgi:hypothetical protein